MTEMLALINSYGGSLALLGSVAVLLIATKFPRREEFNALARRVDEIERGEVPRHQFEVLGSKVDDAEDRISKIEGELAHLPDREVTHRLELSLTEMKGELAAMNERLRPVAATMTRVQEFILGGSK